MYDTRSLRPERIDTGDYTPEEYDRFLREIGLINRLTGDIRAVRRSLLREIERSGSPRTSVLDVGAGSGEVLRAIERFAHRRGMPVSLTGLDLSGESVAAMRSGAAGAGAIAVVQGNALKLPFGDSAFDYVVSSLFAHHLTDDELVSVLVEMGRVAGRGVFLIDLHRHAAAVVLYKIFCRAFGISRLVREDGSLSIRRSFRPRELEKLAAAAGLANARVSRSFPFRLVLRSVRE